MQVLRGLDEAEVDQGLVPGAQAVSVHGQDGGRLPDAATVNWSGDRPGGRLLLVIIFFSCSLSKVISNSNV